LGVGPTLTLALTTAVTLQARLTACAAQLAQARHTEQQLRRQLQEAEEGRSAAEEPLREAELRAKRAEEALG